MPLVQEIVCSACMKGVIPLTSAHVNVATDGPQQQLLLPDIHLKAAATAVKLLS